MNIQGLNLCPPIPLGIESAGPQATQLITGRSEQDPNLFLAGLNPAELSELGTKLGSLNTGILQATTRQTHSLGFAHEALDGQGQVTGSAAIVTTQLWDRNEDTDYSLAFAVNLARDLGPQNPVVYMPVDTAMTSPLSDPTELGSLFMAQGRDWLTFKPLLDITGRDSNGRPPTLLIGGFTASAIFKLDPIVHTSVSLMRQYSETVFQTKSCTNKKWHENFLALLHKLQSNHVPFAELPNIIAKDFNLTPDEQETIRRYIVYITTMDNTIWQDFETSAIICMLFPQLMFRHFQVVCASLAMFHSTRLLYVGVRPMAPIDPARPLPELQDHSPEASKTLEDIATLLPRMFP